MVVSFPEELDVNAISGSIRFFYPRELAGISSKKHSVIDNKAQIEENEGEEKAITKPPN